MVMAMDEQGHITGAYTSAVLHTDGAAPAENTVDSISVSGADTVEICCSDGKPAYVVKLVIAAQGIEADIVESDSYNIYSYKNENVITYILSLKPEAAAAQTIMKLKTAGSGTVTLESAEAVYENHRGETVQYIPRLSLRKGE